MIENFTVTSEKCWEYFEPGHPESPERVRDTYKYLKSMGIGFTEPETPDEKDILRVHTRRLVDEIKSGKFYDPDTPAFKNVYQYAVLSVCGAITAMEKVAYHGLGFAFSLMRPPGHHACRDTLGGFCYLNNIAVATAKYLHKKNGRIAILDIDCHHGNGTQDIFKDRDDVLYVSLHQVPLYPGTGLKPDRNCLNMPLAPGTVEEEYIDILRKALVEIKDFKPSLMAISAGFDTYIKDPLTQIKLKKTSYRKISRLISQLKIPAFAVLEGGYSEDLPECIYNFVAGMVENK